MLELEQRLRAVRRLRRARLRSTCTIADREIVCVLGPSGSGKSTLLRTVAGLVPDARGRVQFDGVDIDARPAASARVRAHVPGPRAVPASRRARQRRVRAAHAARRRAPRSTRAPGPRSTSSACAGFEHRRVSELSGGEQQRVALGPRAGARAAAPDARRAARRTRPRAARPARRRAARALRAARARDPVRHPRSRRGVRTRRPRRRDARRPHRAGRRRRATSGTGRRTRSSPGSWAGTSPRRSAPGGSRCAPSPCVSTPPRHVRGTVASRTFRRDHFLVEVTLDDGSTLQVAVGIDGALPEVGATVGVDA